MAAASSIAGPSRLTIRCLPRLRPAKASTCGSCRPRPPPLFSSRLNSTSTQPSLLAHPDAIVRLAHLTFDDAQNSSTSSLESDLDPSSPQYARRAKRLAAQREVREAWDRWKSSQRQAAEARRMIEQESDEEMRQLAEEELLELQESQEYQLTNIKKGLLGTTDTAANEASGAILELRPGIGGEESALFVYEMTRMYQRWASSSSASGDESSQPWDVALLSAIPTEASSGSGSSSPAYKEAILQVTGPDAYRRLRYESGIHRVQRVPVTTSVAKMQSSTITIVVLPVIEGDNDGSSSSADDLVNPADVKTEVMRSRGAGGQHVNKTESAIRLTHLPTGITVSMQDSRSQHKNREQAWKILRARLMDQKMKREEQEARQARGEQIVGLGRGDRVRTYNWPQDRVTDHRIGENVSGLDVFMEGEGVGLAHFVDELEERTREMQMEERLRVLMEKRQKTEAQQGDGKAK